MSYIDSTITETVITDTTIDNIEKILIKYGYNINKTRLQLTATHGGTWSTNGHFSTITIIKEKDYYKCTDVETAKGIFCKPYNGVLAKIISEAEQLDNN